MTPKALIVTMKPHTEQKSRFSLVSTRGFVLTAGIIFLLTGAAKVWSAIGGAPILLIADPLVGISFRHLMLTVGLLELGLVVVCIVPKAQRVSLPLVAWLATIFALYRMGLWWVEWQSPCRCLGNFTDALHLSPQAGDNIMKVTLAYLLIGSYSLILVQWRRAEGAMARK